MAHHAVDAVHGLLKVQLLLIILGVFVDPLRSSLVR
jgi:hypothetical protein